MTAPNAIDRTPDDMVYIRTPKGQEWLNHGESGPRLDADQRRALLLVNGFTPVCALFGPQTLRTPVAEVLAFLLDARLIMAIEPTARQPQRKWFGPAVVAMAASMRHLESTARQDQKPDAGASVEPV